MSKKKAKGFDSMMEQVEEDRSVPQTQFEKVLDARIKKTQAILRIKEADYSRNDDRYYNFKRAAEVQRTTPEKALLGMLTKHLVSIIDIVEDDAFDNLSTIDEKLGDGVCYLILLEGLLKDKIEKGQR